MKRNESRNETSEKRNDANDNNRKRKSETKNQSQVHNKKAKTKQTKMCRMKKQKEWFKDLADLQSYSLDVQLVSRTHQISKKGA